MKRIILYSLLLSLIPLHSLAQDDMYMVQSKPANKEYKSASVNNANDVTYSGSNRDVDEYNRRGKQWSHYQTLGTDQAGNDIIQLQKGYGIYPDSTYIDTTFVGQYYETMVDADDYRQTRYMSRWDDFYDPWYYGVSRWRSPYWYSHWNWNNPWSYGYYSAYYPWYDPWYSGYYGYSWPYSYAYGYPYHYGWGYPSRYWYMGYYGSWGGYPYVSTYQSGHTGTLSYYDRTNYRGNQSYRKGSNNDNRYNYSYETNSSYGSRGSGNVKFGARRNTTTTRSYENNNSGFGNTRSYSSPSMRSSGSSYSGGNFGGSQSSGGGTSSGGGSRGGGSFGSGRR